ncbi:FliH/SctL family protein [Chenggangzhangella methanolivorans]|uniref:HrpE/YscL family type III secretion apparatus protein n=1 Tax=Chenggangzhangella methanolivorans TaxID=1437009 RepID=A0A9E6R7V6_9HYPH|nr:FliH/SctL family protein [Chenggangzhangella methanolivorans]QZN98463.1 HrpE/YscL family type III secretion apparatus protein [Chenggangzhangella methanolivorans]
MSEAPASALPRTPPGPILKAEQAQAWIDGFSFRDESRREAEALKADTQRAYDEKRAEGFETGRREGAGASAELLAATSRDVDAYLGGLESEIAKLALSIVTRVVGERPPADLVSRLAREALAGFRRDQRLTLTVAPDNFDEVRRRLGLDEPGFAERVTLSTDPALGPLDCRVASPFATVDAGLDAQLDAVRRALSGGDAA